MNAEINHTEAQVERLAQESRRRPRVSSKSYHPIRPRARTKPPSWWAEGTLFMRLLTDDLELDACRVLNPQDPVRWTVAYRTSSGYSVIQVKRARIKVGLIAS